MVRPVALLLLAAALVAGCGGSSDKEAATNPPPAKQISVAPPKQQAPKPVKAAPVKLDPLLKTLPLADRVSQVLLVGPEDAQAPTEGYGGAAVTDPALIPTVRQAIATRGRVQPLVADARPTPPAAAKTAGFDLVLGPSADVGVAGGSAAGPTLGTDAATVTRRLRASLAGYRKAGVLVAPGHLPGQGTASGNPDADTATVGLSPDELRQRDLKPFRALAPTAPAFQLSGAVYAGYDGVTPATLLPEVATALARDELGFGGALISSDLGSAADVLGISEARAAVEALKAGDDLLLVPDPGAGPAAEAAILAAVRKGTISRRRLDEACSRVLALKRRAKIVR